MSWLRQFVSLRQLVALKQLVALALLIALAALAFGVARGARTAPADFAFTNGGEVSSLDPHVISGVPESRVARALFEGLVTRDPRTRVLAPAVAERWERSPDGRIYNFQLRANCTWSNGDPLTAEDFVWSFRRMLEPETASPNGAQLWLVEGAREYATAAAGERDWSRVGIRAPEPLKLEIRLVEPVPHFILVLQSYPFVPVHRASVEAAARPGARAWTAPENLVCNGPYRVLEHRLNDRIRLGKNERYWDASNVSFKTIDVLAVESWTTALNLYLTGAVDWVDGSIPTSAVPELLGRPDFNVGAYHGLYFYRLNTTEPPFDDARVRRALSLALDRKQICKLVLKAGQQPAHGFVPWGFIGPYQGPHLPDEDPRLARELLAQAGYGEGGAPFPRVTVHYHTSEVHRDIAEVVAAQWRAALGIQVRLANQEWKTFLDAQKNLEYDVSRSSWIADFEDASTFLDIWVSGSENNRTGWSNARYDELIARAATDGDVARRNASYFEAENLLFEEMPAIPLYAYVSQNLVSPVLDGFLPNDLNELYPKAWRWRDPTLLASERAGRMHVVNDKQRRQAAEAVAKAARIAAEQAKAKALQLAKQKKSKK